jgi:hypothetical protein
MRFVSIMVTNPFFDVLRFVFLKLPRAKGKMDIYFVQKNVQKRGVKTAAGRRPPPPSFVLF